MAQRTRYIFVTGGVVTSLGNGIAAASLGRLLVARGRFAVPADRALPARRRWRVGPPRARGLAAA